MTQFFLDKGLKNTDKFNYNFLIILAHLTTMLVKLCPAKTYLTAFKAANQIF